MNKFQPLGDRVLVQAAEAESKTRAGIVIPESADKEKPARGKIVAAGDGKLVDGKKIPLQVKEGDEILFGKYAGTTVKLDEKEYLVMREEDILGILK